MAEANMFKLPDRQVVPIEEDLEGWTKISGEPSMKTWIEYSSEDGSMISGWWEATPGTYAAVYSAWEFIHMMEGRVIITPEGGEPKEVSAGDAFVMEANFKGTWEIKEKVLKHFAIKLK